MRVFVANQPFTVTIRMVNATSLRLAGYTQTVENGLVLWSRSLGEFSEVAYVNQNGRFGYILLAEMSEKELVAVTKELLARALFR